MKTELSVYVAPIQVVTPECLNRASIPKCSGFPLKACGNDGLQERHIGMLTEFSNERAKSTKFKLKPSVNLVSSFENGLPSITPAVSSPSRGGVEKEPPRFERLCRNCHFEAKPRNLAFLCS